MGETSRGGEVLYDRQIKNIKLHIVTDIKLSVATLPFLISETRKRKLENPQTSIVAKKLDLMADE